MTPDRKNEVIAGLTARFAERRFIILERHGATVEQLLQVRSALAPVAVLHVVKASLGRVAAARAGIPEWVTAQISGAVAVAFINGDPAVAASAATCFPQALAARGGMYGDRVMTPAGIVLLASIGSRAAALAMTARALRAPLASLAAGLRASGKGM